MLERGVSEIGDSRLHSHYRDRVVIKDGWDVFRREFVCRVADEKACLAHGSVTDHDTSAGLLAQALVVYPVPRRSDVCRVGGYCVISGEGRETHFIVATTIVPTSALPTCFHRAQETLHDQRPFMDGYDGSLVGGRQRKIGVAVEVEVEVEVEEEKGRGDCRLGGEMEMLECFVLGDVTSAGLAIRRSRFGTVSSSSSAGAELS